MISKIDIVAANGVPFRIVLIPAGESENFPAEDKDMIEFYDRRYPHTPDGQFTGGRYYLSTFCGDDKYCSFDDKDNPPGLRLYGSVDAWRISGKDRKFILDWIRYIGGYNGNKT